MPQYHRMEKENTYTVFPMHIAENNENKIWPKLWKSYSGLHNLARKWKASFSVGGTQQYGRAETRFVSCCLEARQKEDKSSVNLHLLQLPYREYGFILPAGMEKREGKLQNLIMEIEYNVRKTFLLSLPWRLCFWTGCMKYLTDPFVCCGLWFVTK